ncbi:MAG: hypothetical protein J5767_02145 [Paludibacteraceae bacterium]|nr:hypothetical protein [Paludibacteraceae bacterium]
MKHLILIFVLVTSQFAYSSESIYGDAIKHLIQKSVTEYDYLQIKDGHDSLYHHKLVFEHNSIFEDENIPSNILEYNIISENSIKEYINKSKKGLIIVFTIEKIDFCETCTVPFYIRINEWHIIKKDNNELAVSYYSAWSVCYLYNCKTRTFKYRYIDGGGSYGSYYAEQEARRKGWID